LISVKELSVFREPTSDVVDVSTIDLISLLTFGILTAPSESRSLSIPRVKLNIILPALRVKEEDKTPCLPRPMISPKS